MLSHCLKRTLQRIYPACRLQHTNQNPPSLVVERAIRSTKLDTFETSLVRNFCIIAHVDHGIAFLIAFDFICISS